MPIRDPARRREVHRVYMRRRRQAEAERTATCWCPICDTPCKNDRGLFIHEGLAHREAS